MKECVLDMQVIKDVTLLYKKKLVIYGTSSKAKRLLPLIEKAAVNIVGVCDGNEKKQGSIFFGHQVKKITSVLEEYDYQDLLILICSTYVEEIIEKCRQSCSELQFLTAFGFQYAFWLNRSDVRLDVSFLQWYNKECDFWLKMKREEYANELRMQYIKLIQTIRFYDPIWVYNPGKVGSTSIQETLDFYGIPQLHFHTLQPYYSCVEESSWNEYKTSIKNIIAQKEKIKIISLVRNPLERDISAIFQTIYDPSRYLYRDMDNDYANGIYNILVRDFACGEDKESILTNDVWRMNWEARRGKKSFVFNWFDDEIQDVLGIDVFAYEFNKIEGYSIIKKDNIECLVLKVENYKNAMPAIADFIGIADIQFVKANSAESKEYKYVYEQVKKEITINQQLLDFYYDNDQIKHFYTDAEIQKFRAKWER